MYVCFHSNESRIIIRLWILKSRISAASWNLKNNYIDDELNKFYQLYIHRFLNDTMSRGDAVPQSP